jgi:beta-glucosidase
MGWEIYPDGLGHTLRRIHRDYQPPALYVMENGAAFDDPPPNNGRVADPARAAYLRDHFHAAQAALADGVPLRGYFIWSLLDNFEWGYGYAKRFGIVHVDFATQQRTLKDSARWYQQFLQTRAL